MSTALRVGVAGLGTVGAATVQLLAGQNAMLAARAGRPIEVTAVSARDRRKNRGADLSQMTWCDDARELAALDDVDVVVELIGGADGIARDLVEAALAAGKHVVTANKALLAHHGTALAARAEAAERVLAYEAAVAGGITAAFRFFGVDDYQRAYTGISARLLSRTEARMLRAPAGGAVMVTEYVNRDAAGAAIEFGETLFLPERVRLLVGGNPAAD